jgi:hypothetical protein
LSRLVEELIRKGRNVAIQVMLLTQRATGDAIPTRIRDNCQVAISFATRTLDGGGGRLGGGDPPAPGGLPAASGLRADPAEVLAGQAPGLRVVPDPPTPGEVA